MRIILSFYCHFFSLVQNLGPGAQEGERMAREVVILSSELASSQLEGAKDIYQACTVNANTSSGSGRRPEWTPHGR